MLQLRGKFFVTDTSQMPFGTSFCTPRQRALDLEPPAKCASKDSSDLHRCPILSQFLSKITSLAQVGLSQSYFKPVGATLSAESSIVKPAGHASEHPLPLARKAVQWVRMACMQHQFEFYPANSEARTQPANSTAHVGQG